jgi:REP element-mobilizing transposase RayT
MMTFTHRHLPHWQPPCQDIFLTWRLHDSLPAHVRPPAEIESDGKVFVRYDRILDEAKIGPLWLKDPRVAACVIRALEGAQARGLCTVRAYVLMANHVHILLAPLAPISKITQQIKGASAREANLLIGRTGFRFWQDESFDHWIRDSGEWHRVRTYIERNPVAAGLVCKPEEWPWSSASRALP